MIWRSTTDAGVARRLEAAIEKENHRRVDRDADLVRVVIHLELQRGRHGDRRGGPLSPFVQGRSLRHFGKVQQPNRILKWRHGHSYAGLSGRWCQGVT